MTAVPTLAAPAIAKSYKRAAAAFDQRCFQSAQGAQRRRVLVGAYTLSPVRGSEPGMGWNICRALAAHHDLTVICAPGMAGPERFVYRDEMERYFREHGPLPGLTVHYVEPPFWSWLVQRESGLFRRTLYYSGYAAWQRAAYRVARELHGRQPFDVVHQLNMTGFREPGYLWKLPAPFVWGPVDGAANVPRTFFPLMGRADRLFYGVRTAVNEWQKRTSRRPRAAARKASRIWVVGEANLRMVRDVWGQEASRVVPLLESGAAARPDAQVKKYDGSGPLRLVWSGIHVGRKALPILLHALVQLRSDAGQVELTVLGDGPETSRWKALAESLGVSAQVRWVGRLPQDQAIAKMAEAHALVLTSLLEATSLVVTEALSLGLPIVCHDACGMGVAVTDGPDACGLKVPLIDPATSVAGFADAIRRLAGTPGELQRLSQGALRRAEQLQWENIAATLANGYEQAMAGRSR